MAGTLFAGTLWNGEILIRNIPADAGSASVTLNAAGTINATVRLPMTDPLTGVTLNIADLIVPGKCFLGYEENGVIINAGPIWSDQSYLDTGTLALSAAGLRSYFDHRFVLPVLNDVDDLDLPVGRTTKIVGTSYRTIAKRLVQQAQSWTAGSVPIVFEPDYPGGYEREYKAEELHIVSDKLKQLTEVENGPDIMFTPRFKTDPKYIEWVMQTGNPELTQPTFDAVRTNLITNPSFDSNSTSGWSYNTGGGDTGTIATSTIRTHSGTYSLVSNSDEKGGYSGPKFVTPSLPAGDYTFSAWVNTVGQYSGLGVVAMVGTPGGGLISGVPTRIVNSWERISVSYTTGTAGVHTLYLISPASDSVGYGTLFVDDAMLEASPALLPYFSGSTPNAPDVAYAWTGSPNASTSIASAALISSDHVWDLTVPTPAIRGVQITRNAATLVTDMYEVGEQIESEPLMAKSFDATLPLAGYVRFEDAENRSSVGSRSVLQDHAFEATFRGRFHEQVWSFEANKSIAPMLGTYSAGDYAVMVIKDNPRLADGRYRLRIMSYSVSVDSNFVQIACAPERIRA